MEQAGTLQRAARPKRYPNDIDPVLGYAPGRILTDDLMDYRSEQAAEAVLLHRYKTYGLAGIHNVLTKVFGSTNPINVVKATFGALSKLRTIGQIEETRGVQLREVRTVPPTEPPAGGLPAKVTS